MGVMGDWAGKDASWTEKHPAPQEDLQSRAVAKIQKKLNTLLGEHAPSRVEVVSSDENHVNLNFHYDNRNALDASLKVNQVWGAFVSYAHPETGEYSYYNDRLITSRIKGTSLRKLEIAIDQQEQATSQGR